MYKLRIATIGALVGLLLVPSAVFAQEQVPEHPHPPVRAAGEISGVVPGQGTFTLTTRGGEELEFQTSEDTKYRSPNGTVEDIHDLKKGMKALVIAAEQLDGSLMARMVAAGNPEDLPDGRQIGGVIEAVNLDAKSFVLKPREGESLRIQTGDRTRYRGEGIEGLSDLEAGMHARAVVIEPEDGGLFALLVAAGEPKDRPDIAKVGGEITNVIPGQGTFTLMNREGEEFELSTNERTKFHSRDGSVHDIHDLKKGTFAMVGAVRQDDGQLMALVVGVGNPEDRPKLDERAIGEVISKSSTSFTIQARRGDEITFYVNDETHFAGLSGYDELEVGMKVAVGAVETDDGLLAKFVGARNPDERPGREPQDQPGRSPGGRPGRGPGPGGPNGGDDQEQEVSA